MSCTENGVYLTTLGKKNNDGSRQKVTKQLTDMKVKFLQVYKQLLFIVGSDLMP